MNLGDVERQLRAGPPEEELYRVQPLVLDDDQATTAQPLAARERPVRAIARLRRAGVVVGVALLVAAAFTAGRLTVPPTTALGPAQSGVRVLPAFVSSELRKAFYSGVDRQRLWLVCAMASSMTCTDASAYRTTDPLNSDEWPYLKPVTVPAGQVIVGAELDPVLPVVAYLSPAANPSAAGPELVPISIYPGDTFLDLGSLSAGRYVLSVLTSPTAPVMSGQLVIGIVVR
jgi:hypothetical protein